MSFRDFSHSLQDVMRETQQQLARTFDLIIHVNHCCMNCAIGLAPMKTDLSKPATYRFTKVNVFF